MIVGDNNHIVIGYGTTIERAHIACVGYNGYSIVMGRDCMLSSGIRVVNTDSHSILSLQTGLRINPEADVTIGDHVWVDANVTILKGVTVGNNSIITAGAIITEDVAANSLVGGIPGKLIKNNITWNRNRL